jgi:hypothetical protein
MEIRRKQCPLPIPHLLCLYSTIPVVERLPRVSAQYRFYPFL